MSTLSEPTGFELVVVVDSEDIDDLAHASNLAYLRWILAAANAHWDACRRRVPEAIVAGAAWVVLRHELEYLAPAVAGDVLRVTTWVPTCTGTTCDRYAEVARVGDRRLLARSASTYCVIDRTTGKPRRLGEALRLAIGGPEPARRERAERWFPPAPAVIHRD